MNVPEHSPISVVLAFADSTREIAEAGNDVVGVIRVRSSGGNTFWMEPFESVTLAIKFVEDEESKWCMPPVGFSGMGGIAPTGGNGETSLAKVICGLEPAVSALTTPVITIIAIRITAVAQSRNQSPLWPILNPLFK